MLKEEAEMPSEEGDVSTAVRGVFGSTGGIPCVFCLLLAFLFLSCSVYSLTHSTFSFIVSHSFFEYEPVSPLLSFTSPPYTMRI